MSAPIVTLARGFPAGMGRVERIVVQPLKDGILVRHVSTFAEAGACRDAWAQGNFKAWPGEIRYFDKRGTPCS